jgi:hypothetical protein
MGVLWGMADLHAGLDVGGAGPETGDDPATGVSALFRARYPDTSLDTATAYNAAGQVIAVVHLGTEAAP